MDLLAAVYTWSLLITSVVSQFLPPQYQYVGCFQDDGQRKLRGEYNVYPFMTQETCCSCCEQKAYKYAGLQNGNSCFCGDQDPDPADRKDDSECNTNCPGKVTTNCGGAWRNAIYSTGAVPPASEYVGCYLDVEGYRRFKGYYKRIENMTPKSCINHCRELSYKYAALQAGWACFCGNEEPNNSDKRNETECNTLCPLDHNFKCGGALRNSVYRTLIPCSCVRGFRYSDYTYLGCYLDSNYRRLRGDFVLFKYISHEMCLSHCKRCHFRYAAVQNGEDCFCGDETPLEYNLRPGECNKDCYGEVVKKCGDELRNDIYCTGEVPPKSEYLGCYLDVDGDRRLTGYYKYSDRMTPRSCTCLCRNYGYKYAGLQAGNHCFCGNNVPVAAERRDEYQCNSECPGDYTCKCGGAWRNSIFKTSKDDSC